jgi:Cu(I)/Ag(I) efflux system membrane protein CusA/SilA
MLEKIIELSIKNKFIVILFTIVAIGWGIHSLRNTPVDAIPDLSDVQVIVFAEYPEQTPQVVEDQVTYPLTTTMLAVPYSKVVRGYSFFGYSFVYIIFEDGTDIYWARSRVLEYLNYVSARLPKGVTPRLGPDATGVGWVYEYALVDKTGKNDLSKLRSIQDWYLRYQFQSIDGVAEVASIGGYVKQYQIEVDPNKLSAYNLPLEKIKIAIERSNRDVGGSVIEMAEREYMVRGLGYIKNVEDVKSIPVGVDKNGTPILLRDVAYVHLGPELRRGLLELNGEGEVAGGIIVMRYGQNALEVIDNVKKKMEELKKGLPEGVEIVPVYDRSGLIKRAIATLKEKLLEESVVVSLVCMVFLLHFRSAFVAIFTLPVAILISFIIMRYQGINANIMSLSGIAIAIGAMVDAAIIMIENAHKHIEREAESKEKLVPASLKQGKDHWQIITEAAKEVGPPLFFSLLVITVSFIPIFTLQAQEGRLFKPLAFTKTYAMGAAALLAITIVPVLMGYLIRGRITPESKNPINRLSMFLYSPFLHLTVRFKYFTVILAVVIMATIAIPLKKLGSEFMPPLYEGDLLYMPTTLPGISITKAREILQQTDKIIRTFPEVHHVLGKIGRAETATDPAPLMMVETVITLKPESEWRPGMTPDKLVKEMDAAIKFPGLTNAWTMPIKTRVDMLSTGIKTPVGIKVMGADLKILEDIGREIEAVIRDVPGTLSVYAERTGQGYYFDYKIKRDEAARYGLTIDDIQDVILSAIGGMNITTTVEGLERYPVNLRYSRELRDDLSKLQRILIPTPRGEQIPITQVADIKIITGPDSLKSEDARLNAWIYIDIKDIDVGTYVENAKKAVAEKIKIPAGYSIVWSGQYEYMVRAAERLKLVVPLTLLIIFFLIYLNTGAVSKTLIVLLAVPFSLVGALWYIYLLGYNMSVAVWVGIIALAGLDAETGVVMLLYLDLAYEDYRKRGLMNNREDLKEAIYHGAVKRVRPKLMTIITIVAGLLPIMWGHGTGSETMKRIAAPMVGGVVTSGIMELLIYPAIYFIWKGRTLKEKREGL